MDSNRTVGELLEGASRYVVHGIVIDASPSMNNSDWPPSRLAAAIDAAGAYLTLLIKTQPNALFGLTMFSGEARTITPLTSVGELRERMWSLRTEWDNACREHGMAGTNIGEGLREASLLLLGNTSPTQIVLLTDGEHNTGCDPLEVAPRLQRVANIAVVGIGASPADVDEDRLKAIASPSAGVGTQYRWIGNGNELKNHFEHLAGRICRS